MRARWTQVALVACLGAILLSCTEDNGTNPLESVPVAVSVQPDGTGDYSTIQAAIDAAADGDTVVLADGVYTGEGNRDLDFRGKAILVKSASNDPARCTIDCEADENEFHRAFYFHSEETQASAIEAITIRNGYAGGGWETGGGGGVLCEYASPRITGCVFTANVARYGGGGLACRFFASPAVEECTFRGNQARGVDQSSQPAERWAWSGGAVECFYSSSPEFVECSFLENAAGSGGAIRCYHSAPSFSGCNFSRNIGEEEGGALVCSDGAPELTLCAFVQNEAPIGGAVAAYNRSAPTFQDCEFRGNSAYPTVIRSTLVYPLGGALACGGEASPLVVGCLFEANEAQAGIVRLPSSQEEVYAGGIGGAVYCGGADLGFTDCRFENNVARGTFAGELDASTIADRGGALYVAQATVTLTDCALVGNRAVHGSSLSGDGVAWGGAICNTGLLTLQGCRLWDNQADGAYGSGAAIFLGQETTGADLTSCTLARNTGTHQGAAFYFGGTEATVGLQACLLVENSGPAAIKLSRATAACTDVHGNEGGDWTAGLSGQQDTGGNLSADPLFCDPAAGDFHLRTASPCAPAQSGCGLIGALPVGCQ